jgi:hypothetical protein
VLDRFVSLTGHAGLQVIAQAGETDDTVLEKVVVLDIRVVVGHHAFQIPVAPAKVVAQHQFACGAGLMAFIVCSDVGHGRLCGG